MIPSFGLYSKEVGDGNENERVATFVYEIRTSLNNANILKNLPSTKYLTKVIQN